MSSQTIMWTGCPAGFLDSTDNTLVLSVFVSPRLTPTGGSTLSLFPDWLNWPQTLHHITFKVRFAGGVTVNAVPRLAPLDPILWKALFRPSTFVRPHTLDNHASKFVMSYPMKNVQQYVQSKYTQLATQSPTTPPDQSFLKSYLADLLNLNKDQHQVGMPESDLAKQASALQDQYRNGNGIPAFSGINPQRDLSLLRLYHHVDAAHVPVTPTIPTIDFHQEVSSLGEYPALLRKLGLVLDLEVARVPGIPHDAASTTLQVLASWIPHLPGGTTTNLEPLTAYSLTATRFAARPHDPTTMSNGFLNLRDGGPYSLAGVDVDGAGLKLSYFAMQLQREQSFVPPTVTGAPPPLPEVRTLPALRSGGMTLIYSGRATQVSSDFQQATADNTTLTGGTPTTLYAEDLIRGYRVDVFDQHLGHWRSLMQRHGVFQFPSAPPGHKSLALDDEGQVSLAATQKDGGLSNAFYVREAVTNWNGWSLVAPFPQAALDPADHPTTDGAGHPAPPPNRPAGGMPMEVDYTVVPGSLPRLRFGNHYRLRVRTVDIAGNSEPLDSTDATLATPTPPHPPQPYLRYEPVVAPLVILRHNLGTPAKPYAGEAPMRLVVRSDVGTTPENYVSFLTAKGYTGYRGDSQRHVVPPRTSPRMAEAHGAWDAGTSLDPTTYNTMKTLEGDFPTTPVGVGKVDPVTNVPQTNYTSIYAFDQAVLPYLPDRISRGATFSLLPPHDAGLPDILAQPWSGPWPKLQPFRLRLIGVPDGSPATHTWDGGSRLLTIGLPQGDILTIDVSSYLSPPDLQLMGLWAWIVAASPSNLAALRTAALRGLHQMFTPNRELTLVHAVQKPLIVPQFQALAVDPRPIGETAASLHDGPTGLPVSGKSTHKFDILSSWQEPFDDPGNPAGPVTLNGSAHVAQFDIDIAATHFPVTTQHTFPDTKYRSVDYVPQATTRFGSYFPFTDVEVATGVAPMSVRGTPKTVDILSSKRPDAPRVLYVIPTWQWTNTNPTSTTATSTRRGRSLRVYLDRPWYSSGAGEMLGVVLLPPLVGRSAVQRARAVLKRAAATVGTRAGIKPMSVTPDTVSSFYTQWGADPIHALSDSAFLYGAPGVANFPLATATVSGVQIAELDGVQLDVAAHPVTWDPTRGRWYADIEITGTKSDTIDDQYFPFVQLALARFQPKSVNDVRLSHIMQADFAQLAPDRFASVTVSKNAANNYQADVTVTGVDSSSSKAAAYANQIPATSMTVTVYTADPSISDSLLTWQPGASAGLPATNPSTDNFSYQWAGSLTLPGPVGSGKTRLVITEYESYEVDRTNPSGPPSFASRIVYAAEMIL